MEYSVQAKHVTVGMHIKPDQTSKKFVEVKVVDRCTADRHNVHIDGGCYFIDSTIRVRNSTPRKRK